jgi:biotin carboxyl carrier protein
VKYVVLVGGREVEVHVDGEHVTSNGKSYKAALTGVPGTPLRQLVVDGRQTEVSMESSGPGKWSVGFRGQRWETEVLDERTLYIRSLTGSSGPQRGAPPLKAPMPGLVVRVLAEPGQQVSAGSGVIVLEAMKMENELRAAVTSVVKTVRVKAGEAVEKGQVLVDFESDHG